VSARALPVSKVEPPRARRRRRARQSLVLAVGLLAVLAVGSAPAIELRAGDIIIRGNGGFSPTRLPKYENAPISLHGGGKISTVSGAYPPILETIDIEYDRHGAVDTTGLPVCAPAKLEATTSPQARAACPTAIVGEGSGQAVVVFPESKPIHVSSPITLFNGPRKDGDPTVLAHAYATVPVPTTFIVPVVIETIHKGVYGYRTKARIPKIAGGAGIPISGELKIGKQWTYRGRRHSYVSARCETGHLQARGEFTFKDGTFLSGTLLKACQVRKAGP
jgi:hypothetical protein